MFIKVTTSSSQTLIININHISCVYLAEYQRYLDVRMSSGEIYEIYGNFEDFERAIESAMKKMEKSNVDKQKVNGE